MNLEVIQFLIEHGADTTLKSKTRGKSALELCEAHCAKDKVKGILKEAQQLYYHPKLSKEGPQKGRLREHNGIEIDDTKVKVGCCGSFFYFCKGK